MTAPCPLCKHPDVEVANIDGHKMLTQHTVPESVEIDGEKLTTYCPLSYARLFKL